VEIKIDKGVPMPPDEYVGAQHAKRTMDVGDSFFTNLPSAASVGITCVVTLETGRAFTRRVEGLGWRVWRVS